MSQIFKNQANNIVLAESRMNYVFLTPGEPDIDDNGKEKYKVCAAMPKALYKKQLPYIKAAIKEAINVGVKKGHFNRKIAESALAGKSVAFLLPFYDADIKMESGEHAARDEMKGMMCCNPWNRKRPPVQDDNKMPITDQDEIYSGMWAYTHVSFFAYGKERPKKGISVYLNAVMKTRDDEPLDGSISAEAAFEAVEVDDSNDEVEGDLE